MDFQVGDRVFDLAKGKGIVIKISNDEVFPVEVYFDNDDDERYTENGYCMPEDRIPSLYHEGTEVIIKPAKQERYLWVNIYLSDNRAEVSIPYESKEHALDCVAYGSDWKYVDTIQLKPKGD